MKLVVILSDATYSEDVEKICAEHRVAVFSEVEIQGFRLQDQAAELRSWFGGSHAAVYSKLMFAFVAEEKASELLNAVDKYNRTESVVSPVRAFQMHVERNI